MKPARAPGVTACNITMNAIKVLAAFLVLAGLSRAGSADFPRHIVELPPVLVQATRLTPPAGATLASPDEIRAQTDLALRAEMQRTLDHTARRVAAIQRRALRSAEASTNRPAA
jgi:hypothetical protein